MARARATSAFMVREAIQNATTASALGISMTTSDQRRASEWPRCSASRSLTSPANTGPRPMPKIWAMVTSPATARARMALGVSAWQQA